VAEEVVPTWHSSDANLKNAIKKLGMTSHVSPLWTAIPPLAFSIQSPFSISTRSSPARQMYSCSFHDLVYDPRQQLQPIETH
jgi:hypothetical protein